MKTNAMRLLDFHNIPYETLSYHVNNGDYDAMQIAKNNGIPVHLLFKTLVCTDEKKQIIVAVIPSNLQLSTKKLEKVSNTKDIFLLDTDDLLGKTGYVRGGCSPLAMKKQFPVFFHEANNPAESIWVNAGKKGFLIKVELAKLLDLTAGVIIDIAR